MPDIILVALVLALGMGAYWSLVLFPRQRDFQRRQQMARTLAEGDEVITGGGIVGKVLRIDSDQGIAYVEIADGVVVRLLTAAMLERYEPGEVARNAQIGLRSRDPEENPG